MITYKVWIEVEQYDTETESGETIDALSCAATAEFTDLDEAIRFGNRLNETGEQLATEYDSQEVTN